MSFFFQTKFVIYVDFIAFVFDPSQNRKLKVCLGFLDLCEYCCCFENCGELNINKKKWQSHREKNKQEYQLKVLTHSLCYYSVRLQQEIKKLL